MYMGDPYYLNLFISLLAMFKVYNKLLFLKQTFPALNICFQRKIIINLIHIKQMRNVLGKW